MVDSVGDNARTVGENEVTEEVEGVGGAIGEAGDRARGAKGKLTNLQGEGVEKRSGCGHGFCYRNGCEMNQ